MSIVSDRFLGEAKENKREKKMMIISLQTSEQRKYVLHRIDSGNSNELQTVG